MKFLRSSTRKQPKISLILLDWSVRESFHLLHYLEKQTLPRDLFEVIIIEYYSRVSEAIKPFAEQVDTWLLLEMPESSYYHKHLMYNVGLAYSKGEITIICDSDAMVKPSFLQTIVSHFENHPNTILHLDQFRSNRREFYPFNYPSFAEVEGEGCINYLDGKTTGVISKEDPTHQRNYGACFCARREDLIAIGGADEHVDLVGYICGPYDLTFRLLNLGREEVWHEEEFLYHTWHPGQTGTDNYLGPHDGRNLSTTSVEALVSRRTGPHVINPVIKQLKDNPGSELNTKLLIHDEINTMTNPGFLASKAIKSYAEINYQTLPYKGFLIQKNEHNYTAISLASGITHSDSLLGSSLAEIKQSIMQHIFYPAWLYGLIVALTYKVRINQVFQNRKAKRLLNQKSQSAGSLRDPRFAKFKRATYRVSQLRREVNMLATYSCDLVSSLWAIKKEKNLSHFEIWIGGLHTLVVLTVFQQLKIFPKLNIKYIPDYDSLDQCKSDLIKNNTSMRVISRELYTRYPSWFVPKLDKFLAVL